GREGKISCTHPTASRSPCAPGDGERERGLGGDEPRLELQPRHRQEALHRFPGELAADLRADGLSFLEGDPQAEVLDSHLVRLPGAQVHLDLRLPFVQEGEMGEALRYRSEEHTSELQSRENLVCRLLLEKKKNENDVTWVVRQIL